MFSRLWRSNQIILCAISGGSLEKLTRAVTYWRAICFLRFRGFFRGVPGFLGCSRFFGGCSGFSWGVPGFLGSVPGFWGVFRVFRLFRNVPWCSGVPVSRCSMFRWSWKYYMPKFPVPFHISTESAPVPLVVKSYKMAWSLSSRYFTGCKMICDSLSLFLIENEKLGSDLLENCGLVVPNFLWEQFVSFSHKYQGRVEFWIRVKLLHMKQLTALKTAPSSRFFSILSSNSWWEMCSSGNRKRSVRPGGKYRSIRHAKISEIQTGIFGRMERAPTARRVQRTVLLSSLRKTIFNQAEIRIQ